MNRFVRRRFLFLTVATFSISVQAGDLGDYRQNAEGFKKMFASTPDIRRDLVKGSLEVYPIFVELAI